MPGAHATPVSECENTSVVGHILLPDDVRDTLANGLAELAAPPGDIDLAMTHYHQVFARLPLATLQQILGFGRHNDTPGALYTRTSPPGRPASPAPGTACPAATNRRWSPRAPLRWPVTRTCSSTQSR
ncbi:hypothetical protein [Streptomyces sp. WM6378]|uniref:hypothetical protein n=1 Tax=Streptomyces sp. WM6378 TaxID=1415557 RepID=UPI000A3EC0A8|nr:hypothetical protein [Streptomyces sp. WM6378]